MCDSGIHHGKEYLMCTKISNGTSGNVFKAIETHRRNFVAIKVQRNNNFGQIELKILQSIRHPHIVEYIDHWIDRGMLYIVMEYADTTDLFNFVIVNTQLLEVDVRYLFVQLLRAIEYAHQNNICHRDIKPENILITDHGCRVMLADWGFAGYLDQELTRRCGSVHYAAPEIIRGIKYDGRKIDIWSIGIILYTMSTGKLPFYGETDAEMINGILMQKPDFNDIKSDALIDLISLILMKSPDRRPTIQQILDHHWIRNNVNEQSRLARHRSFLRSPPPSGSTDTDPYIDKSNLIDGLEPIQISSDSIAIQKTSDSTTPNRTPASSISTTPRSPHTESTIHQVISPFKFEVTAEHIGTLNNIHDSMDQSRRSSISIDSRSRTELDLKSRSASSADLHSQNKNEYTTHDRHQEDVDVVSIIDQSFLKSSSSTRSATKRGWFRRAITKFRH
jgi:serine/threonine protein kinase